VQEWSARSPDAAVRHAAGSFALPVVRE